MPQKSVKRKLLDIIEFDTVLGVVSSKNRKFNENLIDDSIELTEQILTKRYVKLRNYVPKSLCWFESVLPKYNENRFRKNLRATREQFNHLLHLICEDPIFVTKGRPQMNVSKQLAIALYKFGHSGSGASVSEIASKFGVGDGGSIPMIMFRIIKAILNLKNRFVFWPGKQERHLLSKQLANVLPGCIGFVDGTHCNLQEKPCTACPEDYFSRKQRYGLHLQAVCDSNKKIRHYRVGRTASAHDARVYSECSLAMNPSKYFSEHEWIGGDAAYKLTEHVITPFRKNSVEGSKRDRHTFNRVFSSFRVRIEHTFGILFEKFPSLKSLSLRIKGKKSHQFACEWVEACCILYNIFHDNRDFDYFNVISQNENDDEDEGTTICLGDKNGEERRTQLKHFVLLRF